MATPGVPNGVPAKANKKAAAPAKADGKKELKILMLHGYTQSGTLFRSKTAALSKPLTKVLAQPPLGLTPTLIYPTGPHRLRPSDIPGYQPPEGSEAGDVDDVETDNWAWFRRDEATLEYRGLGEGMRVIAAAIREASGVDGVVGFSQGGAMAAMLAAAMEPDRPVPTAAAAAAASESSSSLDWVQELRDANGGRPLKFAVVYSGFPAPDEGLQWLYEGKIQTPTLHFIGALDTVVDEARSNGLVERCAAGEGHGMSVVHPGGHYVPVSKEWVGVLAGFLKNILQKTVVENEVKL
ncbi:serine hydrolase FSH [Xylariales sp. PMI_506]|nr:serine hydrolase FSH [Xylariales sp. PMI_506]